MGKESVHNSAEGEILLLSGTKSLSAIESEKYVSLLTDEEILILDALLLSLEQNHLPEQIHRDLTD